MSVSLLVPGAGDALDVGESLLQGLLAGRGQAGLAEHRGEVGLFGEPGRGVVTVTAELRQRAGWQAPMSGDWPRWPGGSALWRSAWAESQAMWRNEAPRHDNRH